MYDAIVLGTGGVGSAAAFHLANRGLRVLGLDRFPGGHDRGSSHGETRIIRKAYFEHPDYVPLLHRAYDLWHELQQRCGRQLFHQVGLIEGGPPDGVVIPAILEAARQHSLPLEELSPRDMQQRFPQFRLPEGEVALFEEEAGYLLVEQCVLSHLEQARVCGAELKSDQAVVGWNAGPNGVEVRTQSETYNAKKLIITAGAWAGDLLADLGVEFKVRRKHLHWYACDDARHRVDQGCPACFFETPTGYRYAFPQLDERGVKVAEHSGGTEIEDPLSDDQSLELDEQQRVEQFVQCYLPNLSLTPTHHEVCYYTMSPDDHFIVDQHPQHSNVVFAAGLSGHGFKFASVLGEVLADLAVPGTTEMPVDFLKLDRLGM